MTTATATLPATAPPSSSERRIAPRRQPAVGTVCRLDTVDGGPPVLALVWNISTTGVSMLVSEPRPSGSPLTGLLETMSGCHAVPVAARVVHLRQLGTGDYYVGAVFDRPLTEDEVRPFVV